MEQTPTSTLTLVATVVLALLATGCGTMTMPKYTAGPGPKAQTRENQGLKVTADPFSEVERAETYFRTHPKDDGVVIVYLRAENRSSDATWLLTEEAMHLLDSAGTARMNAHDQKVEGDYAAGEAVAIAGAAVISLPMMFASGKLLSDAMVEEKNFIDQEWRNQTLSPGQSAEGFIYFKSGKATNLTSGTSLRLDCLNTRNQQTNTLVIPLTHESR